MDKAVLRTGREGRRQAGVNARVLHRTVHLTLLRWFGPLRAADFGLRAEVERSSVERASTRIHLGVSGRRILGSSACARRAITPKRSTISQEFLLVRSVGMVVALFTMHEDGAHQEEEGVIDRDHRERFWGSTACGERVMSFFWPKHCVTRSISRAAKTRRGTFAMKIRYGEDGGRPGERLSRLLLPLYLDNIASACEATSIIAAAEIAF